MILESEHPLVTPDFIGTDEEKIQVLTYWSELIALIRSLNINVISHENKLAIIAQLKAELELVDLEVNNATAHPKMNDDGSMEMTQDVPEEGEGNVVDLAAPEPTVPPQQSSPLFAPLKISTTEAMQRLAGIWYKGDKK